MATIDTLPPLPVGSTDMNALHDLLMAKKTTAEDVEKFLDASAQRPLGSEVTPPGTPAPVTEEPAPADAEAPATVKKD